MTTSMQTTVPAGIDYEIAAQGTQADLGRHPFRWILGGLAAVAIAVPVTLSVLRSNDPVVEAPTITVTGSPATPEDLRYAAEWAHRLEQTQAGTVTGSPATPEDLRYAAEWAHRLEQMEAAAGTGGE